MKDGDAESHDVPLAAFVEGILDGRVGDATKLQAAVRSLSAAGAGRFRCELHGGRFSLIPEATRIDPSRFASEAQANFLTALQELVLSAGKNSVETNLRCRLIHQDEVAETLFVVRGDRIEPLTRRRPRTADDVVPAEPKARARFGLARRERRLLAPAAVLVVALVGWQSGWIDRAFSVPAATLRLDTSSFGAWLAVGVADSWGNYEVTLRRGAQYPATVAALNESIAQQTDTAQRAACTLVGEGRDLVVQLLDAQATVVAEVPASLRALLTAPDQAVTALLPGRRDAAAVRLAMHTGRRAK